VLTPRRVGQIHRHSPSVVHVRVWLSVVHVDQAILTRSAAGPTSANAPIGTIIARMRLFPVDEQTVNG
jgi:hypothetical protein